MDDHPPTYKILHATLLCEELRRQLLIERLDSIQRFLTAGATVDQATQRLADLTDALTTTTETTRG